MTTQVIELHPDDEPTAAELQAAARDTYRQAAAAGTTLTGAELGRQFGRSDRWGRNRIAECRTTPNGSHPEPPTADGNDPESTTQPAVPDGGQPAETEEMWSRRAIRWVTTAAVVVVAACAARSSYEHQRRVVEMAGNHEAAWYLPLSVDGMMLIASLNMLVRRWDNAPAGWLTWTALLLGGAASLAANIAAAPPTWIGRLVAAWSPLCLIVSYELLMQQLPTRPPAPTPSLGRSHGQDRAGIELITDGERGLI